MNYPSNMEKIRKFANEIRIDVKCLLGEKYEGDLDLSSVKTLPDNIVFNVMDRLYMPHIETIPASVQFNIGGCLILSDNHKVKVKWT